MKIDRNTFKSKIKLLIIIVFFFIIPIFLNNPIFWFNDDTVPQDVDDTNFFDDTPKSSAPPNTNYFSFFKIITIDHNKVAGSFDYSNFTVLISIMDTDLKNDVQPDGDDIAFSTENTWLDHEIELFNQGFNSTHAQLIAWVRVPTLSGVIDTSISMYYGNSTMNSRQNPSGAWEINHRGVWHLNEQSGGTYAIKDSTSYSNDGTDVNSPQLGENGQIYNSIGFNDASGQRIEVSDDASLDISNQLTVEAWINPNVVPPKWMTIVSKMDGTWGSGSTSNFDIYVATNDLGNYYIGLSNPSDTWDEWYSSVAVSTGTWQHFVFTYQSSTSMGRIFVNGAFEEEHNFGIGTLGTNANPFYIGFNRGWTGEVFDGLIDEVRISSTPRSAGWINTEYVNQNDPDSFYNIGSEQSVSSEPLNADDFMYYKIITIDQSKVIGTGSHTNFPVLISIIDNELKYHTQPDGDDIAFSMGGNWLNHEIELYNQTYSNSQAQLVVWVQIPFLSTSTNTTITMYYGNSTMSSRQSPNGVWSSNYEAVWHMNQDPSTSNILDSTSNNNDLNTAGFASDQRIYDGKVGTAITFDGINDYISTNSFSGPTNGFTFEAWFKFDAEYTVGGSQMYLFSGNTPLYGNNMPRLRFIDGSAIGSVATSLDSSDSCSGTNDVWAADTWFHYTFRFSIPIFTTTLYLNGIEDGTKTDPDLSVPHSPWNMLSIASDYGADVWGSGAISEFRVVRTALSSDWILTEYNNQYSPNSFYTIGDEQLVSEQPSNYRFFNYYKIFTIDHTKVNGSGSLLNFPLLISILDDDLKRDVQIDGYDIAFSTAGKWLDHQIEVFNQSYSGTHAQMIAWVRIPFLSTAFDTNITMFYGNLTMSSRQNPTGVWYSDYIGVWHLNENPSGIPPQIKDNTIPASDGSTYGSMTSSDQVSGMIGGALDFDGSNDYIDFGNPGEMQITGEITVQAWFKVDYVGNDYLIAKHGGVGFRGWDISFDDDSGIAPDGWITFRYSPDGTNTIFTGYERVRVNQWYSVVGVFKPNEYSKFFFNGTQVGIRTTGVPPSMNDPSLPLRIARRSDAGTSYVNGIIDEVRVSNIARSNDWIATEYFNHFDPSSFYSVGSEQSLRAQTFVDVQINAIDLYNNLLPNVTISLYQYPQLMERGTTEANGSVYFSNIIEGEYNFTATIHSSIANVTELVNITSQAILLDQAFQSINLICDVITHFFQVTDIDGNPLESGWIMIGNNSHTFKKCLIDPSGHSTFYWVDAPPSEYNYTVYYSNLLYNPSFLTLASGDIISANTTIYIQVELTTVDFTVQTSNDPITPVSGAKLKLTVNDPLGASIVNLTTDINGHATLRWLNSTGIGGDYSLQIEFFGTNRLFNETNGDPPAIFNTSFTVVNQDALEFRILIVLSQFQTELISLNPIDYIEIEWGNILKLRALFNVSNVESGYESLLGPTSADLMKYELFLGGISIISGSFSEEVGNIGRFYTNLDTKELESDSSYVLIVSAQKSGYTIPSDIILQLNVVEIDVELNQSSNDDSAISAYWSDDTDMRLNSYGVDSETLTIEDALFQNVDHEFNFLISDVQNHWNLTKIVFNFYNITWNVGVSNINISIEDPFGGFYFFNSTNHLGWDYGQRTWTGITININSASITNDNGFEFLIYGTFDGTIDVVADAYCLRDSISVQYSKSNISDSFSFLSKAEGWVINKIAIEVFNCYYTSNWSLVDLSSLTNLNFTTNEGFIYPLNFGYTNGSGLLMIDDRIIYPLENQFLFTIQSDFDILFDANIHLEYYQGFFKNQVIETFNFTFIEQGITNGGKFHLSAVESSWNQQETFLLVTGITNGITYFFPSSLDMNITIGGQTFSISDYGMGVGRISLVGFTKNQIYQASIESSSPVNFSLMLSTKYFRQTSYEIISSLSYVIVEEPSVFGTVQYYPQLKYYLKTFDTSLLDAKEYKVRFTVTKNHYVSLTKDFPLNVLERPTLLNGSTEFFRKITTIYVKDIVNFSLLYTDAIEGKKITNLQIQYFIWESYDQAGNVNETGQGNVYSALDNTFILDFDTETRSVGEYLIIVILDKDNYEYKNAMILLSINKRDFSYVLSDNLKNKQTNVVQGNPVLIGLNLTDPTQRDIPVIDATVELVIGSNTYEFLYTGNGTYTLNFQTNNIDAFFASSTLNGIIRISKTDYNAIEVSITIVVEMQQILPGIPTFYFLLILAAVIVLFGTIAGYRIHQNATIPTFVKKTRTMKKSIKGDKTIADSILYRDKEVFVGERIRNEWSKLGLSLEEVFGITLEKDKTKKVSKKPLLEISKEHDNKPLGLILMKWDERIGTEIKAKYPSEINISEKTLMQIYSIHEYSGDKGVITLTAEAANIVSYYTGPEDAYYLLLILNLDDDPDVYEGGIADTLRILLENLEDDSYIRLVPSLFQRLSLYPSLNREQLLAVIYQNDIKRAIISLLREEGVLIKSELLIWLKDKYVHGFIDLDAVLSDLIKLDILKVSSIKDIPSELVFLTNDIFIVRLPPHKLLDKIKSYGLPPQFTKDYHKEVKTFFQTYNPTEEDSIKITEVLSNPQAYETLRLLRNAIVTRDDLTKLQKKGVNDFYGVLKILWDNKMIKVFHDEKNVEYYALLTDFYIDFIFPKYLLKAVKSAYEQKSKVKRALIEYLNILEDGYLKQKSSKKNK